MTNMSPTSSTAISSCEKVSQKVVYIIRSRVALKDNTSLSVHGIYEKTNTVMIHMTINNKQKHIWTCMLNSPCFLIIYVSIYHYVATR